MSVYNDIQTVRLSKRWKYSIFHLFLPIDIFSCLCIILFQSIFCLHPTRTTFVATRKYKKQELFFKKTNCRHQHRHMQTRSSYFPSEVQKRTTFPISALLASLTDSSATFEGTNQLPPLVTRGGATLQRGERRSREAEVAESLH